MRRTDTPPLTAENARLLAWFQAWLRARGLAPATTRYDSADAAAFVRWCEAR